MFQFMITKHKMSETRHLLRLHLALTTCCACLEHNSRCDNSMPKLIDISCRRSVLCASKNNITRIDTVPRHIFKQISLKAQGERTSTTASCHSYCTTAAASAQPRLHYTLNRPRPSYTWTRRPSKCLKHQRQRCFTRGARAGRGLGVDRRRDGWDSLQGVWDEQVDDEEDRYQKTIGGPRREVIQVNNGEIELE